MTVDSSQDRMSLLTLCTREGNMKEVDLGEVRSGKHRGKLVVNINLRPDKVLQTV